MNLESPFFKSHLGLMSLATTLEKMFCEITEMTPTYDHTGRNVRMVTSVPLDMGLILAVPMQSVTIHGLARKEIGSLKYVFVRTTRSGIDISDYVNGISKSLSAGKDYIVDSSPGRRSKIILSVERPRRHGLECVVMDTLTEAAKSVSNVKTVKLSLSKDENNQWMFVLTVIS